MGIRFPFTTAVVLLLSAASLAGAVIPHPACYALCQAGAAVACWATTSLFPVFTLCYAPAQSVCATKCAAVTVAVMTGKVVGVVGLGAVGARAVGVAGKAGTTGAAAGTGAARGAEGTGTGTRSAGADAATCTGPVEGETMTTKRCYAACQRKEAARCGPDKKPAFVECYAAGEQICADACAITK